MKTIPIIFLNYTATSGEVPSWAKEKQPVKMSYCLGLGASFPMSELGDAWNLGFHGFGRADFAASPMLSVWAGIEYHHFSNKEKPSGYIEGYNFSSINLTGDLKVNLTSSERGITPYVFGGAGLAIQKISDSLYEITDTLVNTGIVSYETQTNGLVEFGGGVEYHQFFVQGKYVAVLSDELKVSYLPVTVGVKF